MGHKIKGICLKIGIKHCHNLPITLRLMVRSSLKKKKLIASKGKWVEELSEFLWKIWTNPQGVTNKAPFSLVYGIKAVIPIEVSAPTSRSNIVQGEDASERVINKEKCGSIV